MQFFGVSDYRRGGVSLGTSEEVYEHDSYKKFSRTASKGRGEGDPVGVFLETSSEFVGYRRATLECAALTFKSKGTIKVRDAGASESGYVTDAIVMVITITEAGRARLTASLTGDLDRAEVSLTLVGDSFPEPLRVVGTHDKTYNLLPGDYQLKGTYDLPVTLPDRGLAGKTLTVEMQATLTPVP